MKDMEHEEWLENAKTRKAAKKRAKPARVPTKEDEPKKKSPGDNEDELAWVR